MMQQALNAVIYARYSSHNQTEQSIEGQLRDCYAFAEREGLQVVGEYIDRAITGRTDERPDFQRMIADARKQEFQRVIVWKFDRFSRDRYDSAIYKHKLKQCGVRVLSAMENVGEGDVSIILEALLEASAEQYSLDLSKKVLRGQRESRLKGTFLGGLTPIGYKLENRKLVADERTAPIVRYIFEQYAKGTSKQDIINELATRGILNRHGKPLSHSTLQTILKNKKYIGVYTHGGQDVAGGCEALIDEKTFLKVQEQLSKRKHAPAASKAVIEYLLQGKLYCGYCGFNMFGDSGRGRNGSTYRYYACRRRKKERDCKKKNEKKDFIEWYVVEQTVEYVLTPERIEYIASELVAQYKKDCGIDRIKAYEKQLDRIKAEISRLVDTLAVCPAAARQPIFDKMEQLDAEKQEAELDLSKLRISAKIQISKEHIADWLKQFCNGDALDVDFQKRIIDTFINSVYLYDDKVIIYYNIEGGKQVSYIDMIDSTEEPPFSDDAPGSSGGSDLKRPALRRCLLRPLGTAASGVSAVLLPFRHDRRGYFRPEFVGSAPAGENQALDLRIVRDIRIGTREFQLGDIRDFHALHAAYLLAVLPVDASDLCKVPLLRFRYHRLLLLDIPLLRNGCASFRMDGFRHIRRERSFQPLRSEVCIELRHGEGIAVVVRVGNVHAPPLELRVNAP